MDWNIEIELDISPDGDVSNSIGDWLVDALCDLHVAVGRGPSGCRLSVILTIPAQSIEVATGIAWTRIHAATRLPVFSFRALPTVEFDRELVAD